MSHCNFHFVLLTDSKRKLPGKHFRQEKKIKIYRIHTSTLLEQKQKPYIPYSNCILGIIPLFPSQTCYGPVEPAYPVYPRVNTILLASGLWISGSLHTITFSSPRNIEISFCQTETKVVWTYLPFPLTKTNQSLKGGY